MIDKTREIALKILYEIDKEEAYSNIVLNKEIKNNEKFLNSKDIALISQIVYGTTSYKLTIDEIIKKYSKINMKKISSWILNILRMGIYQIIFLDKIPKSAAVNESVNLAKRYGHTASSNFVNAILRKIDKKDYEEFFTIENKVEKISKIYSMPTWIIEELLKEQTIEEVEKICMMSNIEPNISIRVNKLKITKKELQEKLESENIKVEDGILNDFLILKKAKSIEKLKSFEEGLFTVQDEAAGLTALILNPSKNEKILDCCSSPGGKTTYIAENMENEGEILALDIHPHRVKLVENTAKRLGINIIKTKVADAKIYDENLKEKFDKILIDAPCLGLGVLKRKPDIKWKRKKEDINEITKLQYEILDTCSKYLKNGGELVYSTCSILKEENELVIERFLKNNTEFKIQKIELDKNNFFEKYVQKKGYIKVYQNEKTDGFFICKLKK